MQDREHRGQLLRQVGKGLGLAATRAAWFVLRLLACFASMVLAFLLSTALLGRIVASFPLRWLVGTLVAVAVPLALQGQVGLLVRRFTRLAPPRRVWVVAGCNALLAMGLLRIYAQDAGRALRRHGDWFMGPASTARAQWMRRGILGIAATIERFEPPPEMRPFVIPVPDGRPPLGPWREGEAPFRPEPVLITWFHPLAASARILPLWESRRFGAWRAHLSPPECELGHCGVDLTAERGEPVFATFDGLVERIERDEVEGGRSGKYVRISHQNGKVVTRYIHLDGIRADLKPGDHVVAGEYIGRVGRTGVLESGTHLHFAMSVRPGGDEREHYIDPEPFLALWQLPNAATVLPEPQARRTERRRTR